MELVLTKTELTKMRYIALSVDVKKDPSSKWCSNKHCKDGIATELNGIGISKASIMGLRKFLRIPI